MAFSNFIFLYNLRTLFAVGLSAILLDCKINKQNSNNLLNALNILVPIEWLSFFVNLKWMLLFTDIRQGIFYVTLFTFWIIFCGEHFIVCYSNKNLFKLIF